ncbi:mediator complex, subunit Med16 [Lipomyces japonicus]|uniref:mediator complex, subunit Med16 n=1 Tax=Lipomyces japonicus TaxID=56871 RepID=UPI0034CF682F
MQNHVEHERWPQEQITARPTSRIAWSNLGLIAFAPPSSADQARQSTVYTTYIHCTDGDNWSLSQPTALDDISEIHGSSPIVHLSWNTFGTELAVIDANGLLSIFMLHSIINQLTCIYRTTLPQNEHRSEIVGFKWLNSNKPILVSNPATRQDDMQFHYNIHKTNLFGPWHPINNRQACIAVTRNGKIKFWYQNEQGFVEVVHDLDPYLFSEEYYTLASFDSDRDNSLVLATYSQYSRRLKIFRITIHWNTSTSTINISNNSQQVKPNVELGSINIKRIYCNELNCLTHKQRVLQCLNIISPVNHPESRLIIFATFCSEDGSTIQAIEVTSLPLTLHSNFDALNPQSNPIPDDQNDVVCFKECIDTDKIATGIVSLNADNLLFFHYLDGSVEMKHRGNFSEINPTLNSHSVSSLFDAGFKFAVAEPALQTAISPNMVAFVILTPTGEIKLYHMEPVDKEQNDDYITSVSVALALRHTISCYSNICCEDLMLIANSELIKSHPDFQFLVLQQCHRAIGFSLDLPKDVQADKFLVLPSLQKLLSFQACIGSRKGWTKSPVSIFAWATLNLRLFSFALTFTLKATHQKQPGQPDNEIGSDTLITLLGLSKWCVDFMAFLLQDIYEISRNPDQPLPPNTSSVALVLLLSAVPRLLLRYTLRGLRGLEQLVSGNVNVDGPFSNVSRVVFDELDEILRSGPVQITQFEKLVNDVDVLMRNGYSGTDRLAIEHALFFKGQIPPELNIIVQKFRATFLQKYKQDIDGQVLYFYPISWLGLNELETYDSSLFEIDGIRKQIMTGETSTWRRCVRCGSVTVMDNVGHSKFPNNWTVAFQRTCICGSSWVKYEE